MTFGVALAIIITMLSFYAALFETRFLPSATRTGRLIAASVLSLLAWAVGAMTLILGIV